MFATAPSQKASKPDLYGDLLQQAAGILTGERDALANSANLAALIYHSLPDLNWAGFYWMKGGELVLGPFQGQPACVRIALGKGVCGTAAQRRATVIVPKSRAVGTPFAGALNAPIDDFDIDREDTPDAVVFYL